MTTHLNDVQPIQQSSMAASQVEAPAATPAVSVPAEALIPQHLLDGGECVLLAVKPSLWFVPITSLRWLAVALALCLLARVEPLAGLRWHIVNLGLAVAAARLIWALAEWVSRCYVLTNRRVMTIRGFLRVEVFECPLTRIQHTELTLSLAERYTRTGTVHFATAGYGSGQSRWRTLSRPLEVHEQLRAAMNRARGRGA